jgi:hypothetical protein
MVDINGDICNATEDYIIQQCNCLTVRAHGLSQILADKFQHARIYELRTAMGRQNLAIPEDRAIPGTALICEAKDPSEPGIICLFGQWRPGKITARYFHHYPESDPPETAEQMLEWFKMGLDAIGEHFSERQKVSLAIPYNIGCGLAGGKWTDYRAAIEDFAYRYSESITIAVYHLS